MRTITLARIVCFSFALLSVLPVLAYADIPIQDCSKDSRACAAFIPLAEFSDSQKLDNLYSESGDLAGFINKLFQGAIALGAILAVLRLAWAGFQYSSSDLWSSKEHAKEIIRETLLGLFLLLGIWIILYQINPDMLSLKVSPKGTSAAPASADPFRAGGAAPASSGSFGADPSGFNEYLDPYRAPDCGPGEVLDTVMGDRCVPVPSAGGAEPVGSDSDSSGANPVSP